MINCNHCREWVDIVPDKIGRFVSDGPSWYSRVVYAMECPKCKNMIFMRCEYRGKD